MSMSVLLARQPIVGRTGELFGYELLFRQPDGSGPGGDPGEAATATVLWNALVELGIDQFGFGHSLFVNVPDALVLSPALDAVPEDRLVVEILETTAGGGELREGLEGLRSRGIRVALDDFDPRTQASLLPHADFVKLEVDDPVVMADALEALGDRDRRSLIAERVETAEDVERCSRQGFGLFQGYYFARPALLEGKARKPAALGQMRTLARLQQDGMGIGDVEPLLSREPELCYRILRYATSAFVSRGRRVSTIREAAIAIGLRRLRSLAAMLVVAGLSEGEIARPTQSLVRARFCQRLADERGLEPGTAFLVGLFFELETLLGVTAEQLVEQIGVCDEAAEALVARTGPYGELLRNAIAYERDVPGPREEGADADLDEAQAYLKAVRWAEELYASAAQCA